MSELRNKQCMKYKELVRGERECQQSLADELHPYLV